MKVALKAYIHQQIQADGKGDFRVFCIDMSKYGYILVGIHEFDYEIPAGFNPIAAQVDVLKKGLDTLQRDHDRKVANIKEQIQNLLCIENSVPA